MNAEKCASRSFRSQPVALPISSGAGGYPAELSVVQRGLKKPSLEGFCGNCVSTTLLERMGEPRIDGQWLLGGFSFGVASSAVHNSPPSQDGEILPVEVPPLQTHDFTGAKGKTCRNQNHRVVWLDQLRQKEADLARRQHARYASATAPLSYQVDGISIGQFPSSCMLIDGRGPFLRSGHASALIRPGPITGEMTSPYLKRQGNEPVTYPLLLPFFLDRIRSMFNYLRWKRSSRILTKSTSL